MDIVLDNEKYGLLSKIRSFFHSCRVTSMTPIALTIPADVLDRTEIICKQITHDIVEDENDDLEVTIDEIVLVLYENFLKENTKHYNSKRVYELLSKNFLGIKTIRIGTGKEFETINYLPKDISISEVGIEFDNSLIEQGELILSEIYHIYKVKFNIKHLISQIWINYIEEYKQGKRKYSYKALVDMIKDNY